MSNPLLQPYKTTFGTVPFEEIKEEHFLPAINEAIKQGLQEVDDIVNLKDQPTFENTIEALEHSGELVEKVSTVFFNLNSAETNDEIQKLAREISPLLSNYSNDILLNAPLFDRVKQVWENRKAYSLNTEQMRLLDKTYKGFTRNGANLSDEDKQTLRKIDEELGRQSLQFGENVLAETNNYQLFLSEEEVAGLPESALATAAEEAEAAGEKGQYLITLQMPSYLPFMTYAKNRELREKLFRAYGSKAFKSEEHDNREVIKKIVELRQQRAELLGFKSHAEYILAERMAENPQKVMSFLEEIKEPALPAAQKDVDELRAFAEKTDGLKDMQRWDASYYSEKLKQARFEIDDETLKPYFELNRVIDGAFEVANKLYGIRFEEREDIQKYHPDVITYEVKDKDGSHLAVFYADFFPRKGKRNGAWMTVYRQQEKRDDQNLRPHISNVCNFTKPSKNSPSLLTFNEVLTLFHEFGHALHGILANGTYSSLSGTNVYWDFVELPSQIMENWCFEKECLDLFARHYKTDEAIPAELVERLRKSATFMEGNATLRQLSLGTLDMSYHNGAVVADVEAHEKQVFEDFNLLPAVDETNMSCQFGHIFQGGYSAGYYSYKWAEVLDADAFEFFKERGLFDQEVAGRFRKLLEAGGTEHPSEVYREFRGKDPDPKALLRRAGLLKE